MTKELALAAISLLGCKPPAPSTPAVANRSTSPAEPPPRVSLTGTYQGAPGFSMVLRELPSGGLFVSLGTEGPNAHTCEFEGELTPRPAASDDVRPEELRRWSFDSGELVDPCKLDLIQSPTELRIVPSGCRYYCGARASLDATFAYPQVDQRSAY